MHHQGFSLNLAVSTGSHGNERDTWPFVKSRHLARQDGSMDILVPAPTCGVALQSCDDSGPVPSPRDRVTPAGL